ncbi:prepilin peptidase [Cytobacillus sp. FJAT-54145]|uniref:Prepilin peptidase n=1 Tax=Cytobacillus spartinae TaxID=3299023 RepID=A0ABW6KKR7_9BACI
MKVFSTYLFLIGLLLGSFYNVVGLRVPAKKSIIAPRSSCPNCNHQLTALELIPVLSYLIQGGKCRLCKTRISPIYPIMEFLTGVLFALAPLIIGWSGELIVAWTLISLFVIITVSDLTYMLIPDKILLMFTGLFLFERLLFPLTPWWDSIVGGIVAFLVLLVIGVISKGGMGGGDIKLFGLIGFVVGLKTVVLAFFLSTLLGALFGVFGLMFKFIKRGQPIPFGPFIAVGTLIAYFFGDQIINLYLQFLATGL